MAKRYLQTGIPTIQSPELYDPISGHFTELVQEKKSENADQTLMGNDSQSFGGQNQESNHLVLPTKSKFGEYWIERVYKIVQGKKYGPYLVQRWRDQDGKKRSRYLGKEHQENSGKH
jgi:hypothetical protein